MRRRFAEDDSTRLPPSSIGRSLKCPRCLRTGAIDDVENGAVIIRHAADEWHVFAATEASTIDWKLFLG